MTKKVLYVGLTGNAGGVEAYCLNVLREIDKSKFRIDFLSMDGVGIAHKDEIEKLGSAVKSLSPKRNGLLKYIHQTRLLMKEGDYDIVEFHMMSYRWFDLIVLTALFSKAKIILHAHTTRIKNARMIDNIISRVGRSFVNLIYTTKFACSIEAGKAFFNGKAYHLVVNAIDIEKFKYSPVRRKVYRQALGFKDEFVVGHVGMLSPVKNQIFILEAFERAYKLNQKLRLVLVGDGHDAKLLRRIIEEKKMNSIVTLLGVRNDVNDLMQAFDLFVLPSLYEGLGMVLIEAQAAGLHCYASEDRVPLSAQVTGNLEYITLDLGVGPWSDALVKSSRSSYPRKSEESAVSNAGYDIKRSISLVETLYAEMLMKKVKK